MFISVLELFKIGIGPSSSHTMGPMVAAGAFLQAVSAHLAEHDVLNPAIRCTLKGSLSFTGRGHATDRAICLGLHGYLPSDVAILDINSLNEELAGKTVLRLDEREIRFSSQEDLLFDMGEPLPQHPNGMIFELVDGDVVCLSRIFFSIGGGFISTSEEIDAIEAPLKMEFSTCPYAFDTADSMLNMAAHHDLSIAEMKRCNETSFISDQVLDEGLDAVWEAMRRCIRSGLEATAPLPGGLHLARRAGRLFDQLQAEPTHANVNDWLCAYAMAVNEENAAGQLVVTAPTNGAAGVIPAVLYYLVEHEGGTQEQVREFLLTASAIGGIIKHNSSISGAEVGCQGEVGSASAMAAAGLCAVRGGSPSQVENAAEISLEHHLGMTCDPVMGLVQVPCIERNGFGAIKAYTAASLALRGSGQHFMSLDRCIKAMKETGLEMSSKYKETSLGGLAVTITEC